MNKLGKILVDNIGYIVIIIIVLFVKMYIVSPIRVNGASMNNTLYDKDIMILDEVSYGFNPIERFDIVVIKTDSEYLIKRVIGLPGEMVEYKDNVLYIDGEEVKEKFDHAETNDFKEFVSEDEYFVLGDNRVNSTDSRVLGSIPKSKIKGKTDFIVFPFNRFGKVK